MAHIIANDDNARIATDVDVMLNATFYPESLNYMLSETTKGSQCVDGINLCSMCATMASPTAARLIRIIENFGPSSTHHRLHCETDDV